MRLNAATSSDCGSGWDDDDDKCRTVALVMFRIKSGGVEDRDWDVVLADNEEYWDRVCRNVVFMTDAE
jgi:hypothetical protein